MLREDVFNLKMKLLILLATVLAVGLAQDGFPTGINDFFNIFFRFQIIWYTLV